MIWSDPLVISWNRQAKSCELKLFFGCILNRCGLTVLRQAGIDTEVPEAEATPK